ncbi:MAG: DUF502 domain-containing protein [Flavobacteriaceae bacterium]|nr:MAG: DUF502 domain-containing protein [Flavobacteriaceae bacterium]
MQAFRHFRSYFFRGMAALLPTILTIWIFVQCYIFVQDKVSIHINRGLVYVLVTTMDWYPPVTEEQVKAYIVKENPQFQGDPARIEEQLSDEDAIRGARIEVAENYWVYGPGQIAGFLVVIVGVCFLGAFLASVMGRTIWRIIERALMNAPLIKKVYPYIKQVTDFLLTKKDLTFSKVVAFEYPRKSTWSIGLVTGSGLKKVVHTVSDEFLTVFVPTSPTPFTGYVIMVPKTETIELDMTIEEALRFVISGGVITPADRIAFEASKNKIEPTEL